jgi:predicted Rossmann fold flavoprotein
MWNITIGPVTSARVLAISSRVIYPALPDTHETTMHSSSSHPASTHYDVIVLGAGAAGLFCAFTAAQRGRRVLVLERSNKVGKKILMSGGGRCNFTNLYVSAENFISANPHFCISALNRYTQWDFIAMVERHQIEYEERAHGQLFCLDSARDILSMLVAECEQAGVSIQLNTEPGGLTLDHNNNYWLEVMQAGQRQTLTSESIVVATGALSIPTLGGSGQGYAIAEQFQLPLLPRAAGLVPFMFSDALKPVCERLAGISLPVDVSCEGQSFSEALLFTHRGISGPAILQISNYWHPGVEITINLLPTDDAAALLLAAKGADGAKTLRTLLSQRLPRALVIELQALWWPQAEQRPLAEFSDKALTAIGEKINAWVLKPSATEGYRTAEVTLGGVDTDAISSKTMEAKHQSGLYFIGEVVDVSGHLGGFNFQWAWSSGYTAGLYA